MTRINDVAKTLSPILLAPHLTDEEHWEECLQLARALDAAGHLLPDLPEPRFDRLGRWEDSGVTLYRGQRTLELYAAMDYGDLPETLEPDEARDTAYAMLAAANHAEEHADDRWNLPLHRTEAGYPNCSTCDGGGCPDCTDPA